MEEQQAPNSKKDKRLVTARKRFQLCQEAERKIREAALDDLKFRAGRPGDQWPDNIRLRREAKKRPCLTMNVLPARERQILNDQRQNRPAIQVNPVDDNGDPEVAKILQGMIRHIEYDSNADAAYDTACASQVRCGFGYFGVLTDYEGDNSFDQKAIIRRFRNAFMVYMDPNSKEADRSDIEYAFVLEDLTKDDYKQAHPNSELAAIDDWDALGAKTPGWFEDGGVRIAEYWYRENVDDTLLMLKDGTSPFVSDLPEGAYDQLKASGAIIKERDTKRKKVKFCKINPVEILEETDWPGKWIPIVPVLGDELDVDGELILEGMVRHTKDAIRMSNVMASSQVEAIGLAPKAPWVGVEGQFAGRESEWSGVSEDPYILQYKPVNLAGGPAPPPQRVIAEPAIQAISEARLQFQDDIKAITGIYDAQLGQQSNEKSGIAIHARQQQGQMGNFHFVDNLTRSIRHLGRILLDLIPKIYDTPRIMRIIGEDGTQETVNVNQRVTQQDGMEIIKNDLTIGRYDVTVSAGPSYQTKRQQAVESMLSMAQAYPPIMQIAGDKIVKNMDWPGADEIAARLEKTLPPGIAEPKKGEQEPLPPQVQQQITQLTQQNQQLTQHLEMATEEYQTEKQKADHNIQLEQTKFANAKELALIDRETQLLKIEATIDAQAAKATMEAEIQQIHAELDAIRGRQEAEHAAGLDMSAAEHGSDLQMQQAEHGSELQMQQAEHAQSIAPTESEGAE